MPKFYDWQKTMSYQTGTNGEICFVLGAKGIGKTFGLRKICVDRFIKHGELFCEICRTNAENMRYALVNNPDVNTEPRIVTSRGVLDLEGVF